MKRRRLRWLRITLRITIVLIGLFIIACLIFDHYVQFRKSDEQLKASFQQYGVDAEIGYFNYGKRTLRYVHSGHDSLPTLVFLHGSPGSMSYYTRRFADSLIRNNFQVFAMDRPGYGYSGLGDPEPSIQVQADMVRVMIDSVRKAKPPVILVAGSYGASIACRLAMDHPSLVQGLVLTGPALGPGMEKMFWFTPVIEHWSFRWFIPRIFRSANTEKMHHKKELEKMLPEWKNIRVPVVFLQGIKDNIVDTSNARFAKEQMVNAPYLEIHFFPNREHRLAQFEWPRIRQAILKVDSLVNEKKAN